MTFLVVIAAILLGLGWLYWAEKRRSGSHSKAVENQSAEPQISHESLTEPTPNAVEPVEALDSGVHVEPEPELPREQIEEAVSDEDEDEFDEVTLATEKATSEPLEEVIEPAGLDEDPATEQDPLSVEHPEPLSLDQSLEEMVSVEESREMPEEGMAESPVEEAQIELVAEVVELFSEEAKAEEPDLEPDISATEEVTELGEYLGEPTVDDEYSEELAAELPPSTFEEEEEFSEFALESESSLEAIPEDRQEVSGEDAAKLIADAVESALQEIEPIPEVPSDGWLEEVTALAGASSIKKLLLEDSHSEILGTSFKKIGEIEAEDIAQRLAKEVAQVRPRILPLPNPSDCSGPAHKARQLRWNVYRCVDQHERAVLSMERDQEILRVKQEAEGMRRRRDESAAAFSANADGASFELRMASSNRQIQRSERKVVSLRAFDKALEIYEKWERRDREVRIMRDWRENQASPIRDNEVVEGQGFTISGGTPLQKVDIEILKAQLGQALAAARAGEISEKQETGSPDLTELDELAQVHSLIDVPDYEIPRDYVPAAESIHELFQLKTVSFEGPLDLLLFLIRRHHLDILDIPISFICAEYLSCLKSLQDLNIDVAAEFLLMVADLLHIKSKCLLPRAEEVDDEEETDPRWALVQRLLEYQKYRDVAQHLGARDRLGRNVFERIPEQIEINTKESKFKEVGAFELIRAFDAILKRKKTDKQHNVIMETISLREKILELIHDLSTKRSLPFHDLIAGNLTRIQLIVTFLACLEMAKLRLMKVFQSESGALYLEPRFTDPHQATQKLDGLDEDQYA